MNATVCKAVDSLEQQCQKMKEQLFEIKIEVNAKASEIVAETKAKGKAALHKVSEFFGKFQYGAETFEAQEREATARMTEVIEKKDVAVISDKSR